MSAVPGVELNSGSLGHGLSVGAGMALAGKMDNKAYKVWVLMGDGEQTEGSGYDGVWGQLEKSLAELRTDVLDLVHLHSLGNTERWEDIDFIMGKQGALQALCEAKEKGVIRFIGLSAHNAPSRCIQLIESDKIDVVMMAVNFVVQIMKMPSIMPFPFPECMPG